MASAESVLVDRERAILKALALTGVSIVCCDGDLNVIWAENIPAVIGPGSVVGNRLGDFLSAESAQSISDACVQARQSGHSRSTEFSIPSGDGLIWYWASADWNGDSSSCFPTVLVAFVEITDQKRREQTLRTLLREVAHRSKNLLAIIQSIALQTSRHADSVEAFLQRFRGRLQSLASTQDLVTLSNWRGANLRELVESQISRYTTEPLNVVRMTGENPYLNPNAAVHIGLAVHELVVNSISYGALAKPNGHVELIAEHRNHGSGSVLTLVWNEAIDVKDETMGQKKFGSVALERVVPASLGGEATLELTNDHLVYSLSVPKLNFHSE